MTTDISVSVRWDPATQQEIIDDYDYDGGNSSSRLFERSRIKALAGKVKNKTNSRHQVDNRYWIRLSSSLFKLILELRDHVLDMKNSILFKDVAKFKFK